ncbi:MAG: hypothetical protein K8T89_00535 [Planctomycetes bacterium]|nr:hypothetical protein [Planctomycetota bacterium]
MPSCSKNKFDSLHWPYVRLSPVLVALAFLLAGPQSIQGRLSAADGSGDWVSGNDCYSEPTGTDLDAFTYVPTTPSLRKAEKAASFKLTYDENVPQDARTVFQYAADIWAVVIESPVPITVEVKWFDVGAVVKSDNPSHAIILGQARPTGFRRDFFGAPKRDVWYPNALANKLAGKDLDPDKSDIIAAFNSKAHWYFGIDGATPRGKYDLLTVVLHEFGHGLGLATSMKVQDKEAAWGIKDKEGKNTSPTIFDTFAKNQEGEYLIDTKIFPNPSAALRAELTSRKIHFSGRLAAAANGGVLPPLHAPAAYKRGATLVHLAENAYTPGNINSLFTPSTFRAEAVHHPGPIVIGMLRDMGWGHIEAEQDPKKKAPPVEERWVTHAEGDLTLNLPESWQRRANDKKDEVDWILGDFKSPKATFSLLRAESFKKLIDEMPVSEVSMIQLGGQKAVRYVGGVQGDPPVRTTFVVLDQLRPDGRRVGLICSAPADEWGTVSAIYAKILESVKIGSDKSPKR